MLPKKIDTREELIIALTEAAELEHCLLCQYLFAAFSMRTRPNDGVVDELQADQIRSWARAILDVAREEMAHLGTVCNLLTAIGGVPYFGRPNFPQPPMYYQLAPFTLERFSTTTIQRFINFEKPLPLPSAPRTAEDAPDPLRYRTIGDLYGQIRDAFEQLNERYLFITPPDAQDDSTWLLSSRSLISVKDRDSAIKAISFIIEEGEGRRGEQEDEAKEPLSHHGRFLAIKTELGNRGPDFEPARPVIDNPMTREHRDNSRGGHVITDQHTLEVAELFNVVYGCMILMLMQYYAFAGEAPAQRLALRSVVKQLMSAVIRPLGEILTTMPAGKEYPNQTAGPGFEFYANLRIPVRPRQSWHIFQERLTAASDNSRVIADKLKDFERLTKDFEPSRLKRVAESLYLLVQNVEAAARLQELP